jgi:hypothetical protein
VFVQSFWNFWRDYDYRHNTLDDFKEHCRFLENARQAYVYDELGDKENAYVEINGNSTYVHVCSTLEEVCAYIEKYREETLFGPWRYTPTDRVAPQFPAEKLAMKNLTFALMDHARPMKNNAMAMFYIQRLQNNFDIVISELNLHYHPAPVPADSSVHGFPPQAHCEPVDSLLKSLAQL